MRLTRYREKIEYIIEALENIPESPERSIEISGTFYNLLTAIESAMDIAAMLVKDLGSIVEDDYANVEKLEDLRIIDTKLTKLKNAMDSGTGWFIDITRLIQI